jgi:cobalamin synthase
MNNNETNIRIFTDSREGSAVVFIVVLACLYHVSLLYMFCTGSENSLDVRMGDCKPGR